MNAFKLQLEKKIKQSERVNWISLPKKESIDKKYLVCENAAVGVTSFGDTKHCNSPKYPNVYTKISPYLPWIYENI